jgi:hypothetical protein
MGTAIDPTLECLVIFMRENSEVCCQNGWLSESCSSECRSAAKIRQSALGYPLPTSQAASDIHRLPKADVTHYDRGKCYLNMINRRIERSRAMVGKEEGRNHRLWYGVGESAVPPCRTQQAHHSTKISKSANS